MTKNPVGVTSTQQFITLVLSLSFTRAGQVGSGRRRILLMPGALGTGAGDFPTQLHPETGLAASGDFTVLAWDPPGFGKSLPPRRSWPIDFYDKDAASAAEFLRALRRPEDPGERFDLLGWSDGGVTAMIMAAEHKDVVRKVAVWGANSTVTDVDLKMVSQVGGRR